VSNWPAVAVIMPVLNEERHLGEAVKAIFNQNYPGHLRVVLAIGPSKDRTMEIAKELKIRFEDLVLLESPTGRTPDSLNLAIKNCSEEIVVRVDAHAELSEKYIETAVETLLRTGADNVGGIMAAEGQTDFENSVAAAMTSPLGVGSAVFHIGGSEGPAESVYLGVFKKSALDRVGGYDTKFTRAQDWEMNHRIRSTGGLVWFNPNLKVVYRPRSNFRKLAEQYFQYGNWRREVMRAHPETKFRLSALRYFAPPLALLGVIVGVIFGLTGLSIGSWLKYLILLPATYLSFILISALFLKKKTKSGTRYLPFVLATMQMAWGSGFIFGKFFSRNF